MKRLTLLVPAYREGESLASNLEHIIEGLNTARIPFEIIVIVDTVPDDDTQEVARRIASTHPEIRLLIREGRQGVGTAISTGITAASGEIVMPVMGDASESPGDVITVALKAYEGFDIVVGNRFLKKTMILGYPPLKYCLNRLCNLFVRLLLRVPTSDITNAFKAYSKRVLKDLDLRSKGYSIFLELPIRAYLSGRGRLAEVPVHHVAAWKMHGLRTFRDGLPYCFVLIRMLFERQVGICTKLRTCARSLARAAPMRF